MKKAKKLALVLLFMGGSVYGAAAAFLYLTQDNLIFPRTVNKVEAGTVVATPLDLTMEDGTKLRGAVVDTRTGEGGPTLVLLFGGNAHDIAGFTNYWGTNILTPEDNTIVVGMAYRGYPTFLTRHSEGTPTETLLHADARGIYTEMVRRYQPSRVVLVGYSLGTAVAARLAYALEQEQNPVDQLTMVAPFTSMEALATMRYPYMPVRALLKYPFDTAGFFGRVETPTLIIYTPDDTLVPPSHAKALHAQNRLSEAVPLSGTTHGDILYHSRIPSLMRQAAGLQS